MTSIFNHRVASHTDRSSRHSWCSQPSHQYLAAFPMDRIKCCTPSIRQVPQIFWK